VENYKKKIVATRCQISRLKCTKVDFGWGSAQTPLEEPTALPQTPYSRILEGLLLKGGVRKGRQGGREGERIRQGRGKGPRIHYA
jgi:hypothetical protein